MTNVVLNVEEEVDNFDEAVQSMYNQDYDLNQIFADFVKYWPNGREALNRYYSQYGSSIEDREDGMTLYSSVINLYEKLARRLRDIPLESIQLVAFSESDRTVLVRHR